MEPLHGSRRERGREGWGTADEDGRRGRGPAGDEEDRRGWGLTTGGDRRRGAVLLEGDADPGRLHEEEEAGAICIFLTGSNGRVAHIRWLGLDRPKLWAGAPVPISALKSPFS